MNYCIWIVSPRNYRHSLCFHNDAYNLSQAFMELGYTVPVLTECPARAIGKVIVFGAHLLIHGASPNWILYNLEQIGPMMSQKYLQLLSKHEVWDYSKHNIAELAKRGIKAKHLPVGYTTGLSRITAEEPTQEILFYGSLNERRQKILDDLKKAGVKPTVKFNVYGKDMEYWIARSKLVINIHHYEAKIFEMTRCAFLMANKKCIVSEDGNDKELEEPYSEAISFVPYDGLVTECLRLLSNEDERRQRAEKGYEIFSKYRQADYLKAVL